MRKFVLKSVVALSLFSAGAVATTSFESSKSVVYAEEVAPQAVTVTLDDYGLNTADFTPNGISRTFYTGVIFNLDTSLDPGSDGSYSVSFDSLFSDDFTYYTHVPDVGTVSKTGKVGTPFLVEFVSSTNPDEVEAKLITIEDKRTLRGPISEETVALAKTVGATATNQYGDVTLTITQIGHPLHTKDYIGLDVNQKPCAFVGDGTINGDFLVRTSAGYRLIHLVQADTPPTPDPDAKLDIQDVTDPKFLDLVQQLFPGNKVKLFDISLLKAGAKVQPNGSVEVSVPIPADFDKSQLAIYYVSDDGKTKEKLDGKVVGDTYVFTTTNFSYYALVAGNATIPETGTPGTQNPKTGTPGTQNPTTSESPVRKTGAETTFPILSAIIAVIGSAAVIYRKKFVK